MMGARGPVPKPAAVEKVRGNPGKRAKIEVMEFPGGEVVAPSWFTSAQREVWDRVVAEMRQVEGLLKPVDRDMLIAYCVQWSRYVGLHLWLQARGRIYKTKTGYFRERPECKQEADALKTAHLLAREFGFTPSARTRLDWGRKPNADDATEDMFGGFEGLGS